MHAQHYKEANHGSSDTLKIFGTEHVKISPKNFYKESPFGFIF